MPPVGFTTAQRNMGMAGKRPRDDPEYKDGLVSDDGFRSIARSRDRRRKPRICVPFHAMVRGVNNHGEDFFVKTVLDNVSGDGLYMRMMPTVKNGTNLFIEIELASSLHVPAGSDFATLTEEASIIVVDGVVLRTENKAGGVCGLAVAFEHVRFT